MKPTPRNLNCGWLLPKAGSACRLGTAFCRSFTYVCDFSARSCPEITDMAMPTFCADSSRRCAVTTISSRLPPSLAPAGAAAEGKEPAQMTMAPDNVAATHRINMQILPENVRRFTACAHHRRGAPSCEVFVT